MKNYKQLFAIAVLCFFANFASAQKNITITGVVTDSLNAPLDMANVVAINLDTKVLDGFGITSADGKYKINVKSNSKYSLKISYLGFKTREINIETKEVDIERNFALQEQAENLDEIELTYEMPIVIKGDTIEYNADSFSTGTERKLEDVLKNLPGVEVNDDGEIEVEGKTVGKVMVEGKDFFDGDSKLASKNIPSNALDKIQVLRNFNEVGQLGSVRDNQDSYAINIKLKEGKKNFWFGEITAGAGNEGRFIAHPKLFYYHPDYSINVITNFNNLGEVPFSRRDYFRFTGGFRGIGSQSGTNFNVGSSDIGFLSTRNNRAKEVSSRFGAANFSFSPTKSWDLSGFVIYSGNDTDMQENTTRIGKTLADGTTPYQNVDTENLTAQKSDLGLVKLSAKYQPDAMNQMDYDIFGRLSGQREDSDLFSSLNGDILEGQKQNPYSINQNLNYYYTASDKDIFALEAQYLIQDDDPFYNAQLTQTADYGLDYYLNMDPNQTSLDLHQEKNVKTNKLDARVDYWRILGDKSNMKLSVGSLLSTQKFNSDLFQVLDNGSTFSLDPIDTDLGVSNDVKYNFNDLYVGAEYRLKTGIFTITPAVTLHSYVAKNIQLGSTVTDNFTRLLPSFVTRIQLKKSEDINFVYRMQTSFSDVNQFAADAVLNNYNRVYFGNRELESATSHNLSLRYNFFNMFNFSNIRASVSYNKRADQVRGDSRVISKPNLVGPDTRTNSSVSSPFNSNFADESVSANGSFERTFGKIKAGVGANWSYSKFNQLIQGQVSSNENISTNYNGSLGTRFSNAPNIEVGYRLAVNGYEQPDGSKITYYNHTPNVKLDATFLKHFIFNAEYSHNNYKRDSESLNSLTFMDATLGYQKKDSKWEYILGVSNLFDTTSLNQDQDNTLFVSTSEYFIQPRYITLKVRYNL